MFDILKTILELLLGGSEAISGFKEKKRRRVFVQGLLEAYIRLSEIISTGETIVDELEHFVERCRRYEAKGEVASPYYIGVLETKCAEQGLNLKRLEKSIHQISWALLVLEPEVGRILETVVSGKASAIRELATVIGTGHVYLGPEPRIIESSLGYPRMAVQPSKEEMLMQSVQVTEEWPHTLHERIESYLAESEPRKNLKDLSSVAMQLRKFLVDSAGLDEILWSVEEFKDTSGEIIGDSDRAKFLIKLELDGQQPPHFREAGDAAKND